MANEYLKPQIPLKDLNSENYFYPLTTIDQIILQDGTTRLNSLLNKTDFTANRAIYYNGTKLLSSGNIFLNDDQVAINKTSITEGYNFEVNGNSNLIGNLNVNGLTVSGNSSFTNTITGDILSTWHLLAGRPSNTTNFRTYFETVSNLHHDNPARTDSEISYNRWFASNSDQTTYGPSALNLPVVDQHVLSFGSSNDVVWSRHIALDIRTNKMFLGGRVNNTWQNWSEVIVNDLDQTITGQKTFNQLILGTSNQARYLENRGGSTVTIYDTVWNHGETPPGHANRATVWHQRWTQSGLTYTPSGGSATALTDCGDIIYWLSSSTTANELMLNIAIDGLIRAKHGHFLNRLYCNEWIQFSGNTGLYFPNSGSGTHLYPANNCTYGSFQMQGAKGGYYGITSGPDNNYLTLMSTTQHQGLYNTATGMWVLYYDKTNKRIGIYGSATDGSWPVRINANTRINNSLLVAYDQNGSIWCGQNKDTAHGEHQVGVASGAGTMYMYAAAAANGNRGMYGTNNAGTAHSVFYIGQDNYVHAGTRWYGAVWNDYAEFRKGQMNSLKPGQVVTENGNGTMKLANQRLQKGCKILSDTYGYAIGETTECKLPIAVSGRVLVYCDTPNEELEPGDCLCANYTGNSIKMTQEEIIKYPDRIIGTVSEFPDYEVWHAGDQTDPNGMKEEIKVNGRIWVYVR